jgi:hypothetical protein
MTALRSNVGPQVFGDVEAPLVLALGVAAAMGGLVVGLAGLALRGRRKRR